MLRVRELIPPLTMRLPDGRTIHAWDFKQKKSLVIVFLEADCPSCEGFLKRLVENATEVRSKNGVILAAFLEPPPHGLTDGLPEGIYAGAELSGRSARAFLGEDALSASGLRQPGVFVTDRYGELAAGWLAADHQFPAVGEILECLNQIEVACEECYPPHWPVEG